MAGRDSTSRTGAAAYTGRQLEIQPRCCVGMEVRLRNHAPDTWIFHFFLDHIDCRVL